MSVNYSGEVYPAASGFGESEDNNGDGVDDVLNSQGCPVFSFAADPSDPLGPSASGGSNLPWDDEDIWTQYEHSQNILVGQTTNGQLEINGSSALRYQHVVLGGHGSNSVETGLLYRKATNSSAWDDSADFDYVNQAENAGLTTNGYGVLEISGTGSKFSNIPYDIEADYANALTTHGIAASSPWDGTIPSDYNRPQNKGFNLHVGLKGGGLLYISGGGIANVQNVLTVGLGANSSGRVVVTGASSLLKALGEQSFENLSANPKSIIGGDGSGQLEVLDGAIAHFAAGLSCGQNGLVTVDNATVAVGQPLGESEAINTHAFIDGNWSLKNTVELVGGIDSRASITIKDATVVGPVTNLGFLVHDYGEGDVDLQAGLITLLGSEVIFTDHVTNDGTIVIPRCTKVIFAGGLTNNGTMEKSSSATIIVKNNSGASVENG